MPGMLTFECSACGECCRNIGNILSLRAETDWIQTCIDEFPYEAREDGSCSMLTEDGKCSVYADRPLLCNVEKAADTLDIGMTKAEWFSLNGRACNYLMDQAGLPSELRVRIHYEG